jgi:signal transduction histidine kinase
MNRNGIGLGLKICDSIINSLGGKIEVDSELNKGTKFIVILPIKKSE